MFKIILIGCLLLLFLLGAAIIAIQFPAVQTKIVNKASEYLSEAVNFPIQVEGVDIDWFDEIILEGVTVHDPRKGKMVYLKEAVIDFEIISIPKGKFNIDKITLRNGRVNMIRYAPDGMTNLTDFIDALRNLQKPSGKNRKPVPFEIAAVDLENMYFSYYDQRKPVDRSMFDHNHFSCDSIYANVTNLRVIADTFQINVVNLTTVEPDVKLRVHQLTTLFTLTKRDMTFDKLYAHAGNSKIKDYLRFNYKTINDLSYFNDRVEVISYQNNSEIEFSDLSKFAPALKRYKERVHLSGFIKGKVIDFTAKELMLSFGKYSSIQGKISFNGLPNFKETFIECKFKNTTIHGNDLKQYLDNNSYSVLKKFGKIEGNGEFIGFPLDFVTNGSFQTNLGKLVTDIRLNAKKQDAKPEYNGKLQTYAFNLGKLLDLEDKVQLIDMNGTIEGAGFKLEDAEVKLNANITRLGINKYNYRNIKTNAKLSERTFNGYISVKDSNLVLEANGKIDLTKNMEVFDIKANLQKANLKPLHISDIETLVHADMDLNFKGTKIDEIVGEATFHNTYLLFNNSREIELKSLYASSYKEGENRNVKIHSDLLTLDANGNFNFTSIYKDIQRLYDEYKLNVINDKYALAKYYAQNKVIDHEKYKVDYNIHVKNLNSLFEIYAPGLYLSEGLKIEGNFIHGNNAILNMNTHIDTLYYKNNEIFNTDIEISTSKLADSSNVLAMVFINSSKQKIDGVPETGNFVFEGIWDKRVIDFTTNVQQNNSSNKLNLKGNLSFLDNKKELTFTNNSSIDLLNNKWVISPNNKIFFSKNEIAFENFVVANRNQYVAVNGAFSQNADKLAQVKIGNLDIQNITPLLAGYNLDGIINANIVIKDVFKDLDLAGDVNIKDFTLEGFLLGNVTGKAGWDHNVRKLLLDVQLERNNVVTIDLDGYVRPETESTKEELNLTATLDNADLKILSPLLEGFMSDLGGEVNGTLKVQGNLKDLAIEGKADVNNGKFKIDYLGTTYYFDDAIYLEADKIAFRRLKLRDELGNPGTINGDIAHDGFKNFIVNITGRMNHLHALNTTEKDNSLFYGTAYVTGNMEIFGPFANLEIRADATSNKGTKIFIPLNSYEGLEQQSFIKFEPKIKTTTNKETKEDVDLSGIKLDFNFELTPDAYAEIIFDKRAGDIISGYGNGNIKMTIDTRGDFNMYGNYRIAKGAYNYTLAGLISKEFTIEPNSSITWTGDPYGGILDVKAYFENDVSIAPLIDPVADSVMYQQEKLRVHKTKVLLDLDGDLMSPQITLDIDITPRSADANTVATTFESDIKRNEQELNRQVFSLLVLGNFSPANSFTGIGGSASNVSQLLTNQLGNWLSQVDENLIIDIDLNGLDKEALNTFNLRLSYTFLEGRLRVSRDGNFSNFQSTNQQSLSSIAGEWTVEYLLSKEGKFRLKLYNRNNQNVLLNNFNGGVNSSAGFSVLHTQSFNSLGELLGIKKKSNTKESEQKTDGTLNLVYPYKEEEEQ